MSSRPSRSSSIPIPRSASSSSARDIESLIPFVPPGRHQPASPSSSRSPAEPRRVSVTDGSRPSVGGSSHGVSTSPTRSTARSTNIVSSVPGRGPSRTRFEPRVVRHSTSDLASVDRDIPPQPPTSPSHARRASMTSLRSSGVPKPIIPHIVSRTTPVAFPRPAYLDHSSLRHLLHTEIPIQPIPSRRADPSASARNQAYANAMSTSSDDDDSGTASPVPPPPLSQADAFKLPTRWSDQDRHPSLSVSPEGRELTYHGASCSNDKDAAAAKTSHPIPPACGIFYYEIEILGKEQKARISVGFAGKSARLTKLPGYEPNSWGYYGEDGNAYSPDRSNAQYGQAYGTGDIIGCGIDFSTYKAFFTKNGVLIGSIFDNVGSNFPIYPTIGIRHSGEAIRANFGQESFKYDIDYHVQQQRNATWNKILGVSLDRSILRGHNRRTGLGSIASITNDIGVQPPLTEEESKDVLDQLVMSYLVHHGYVKTARAFERQSESRSREDYAHSSGRLDGGDHDMDAGSKDAVEGDIEYRTRIVNFVQAGDIDSAIKSLRMHYPTVLEADKQFMLFKLRFRKFVELILATTELKKKMKSLKERDTHRKMEEDAPQESWMDQEMSMDIDEDAPAPIPYRSLSTDSNGFSRDKQPEPDLHDINNQYETALNEAISYGQALSNDYHSDSRPELQQLFKKTFGIVAWEDPLEPGGPMADIAGQESRIALAHEINQAILKSQGRPAQPALETLYRHTATCVTQVGMLGVGSAAFADMSREFLQ